MELVNINKYESIADRIKRLGQVNQQATTTPTFPNMHSPRSLTPTSYNHYQKRQPTQTYKPNYFEKKLSPRITTQDTEQSANQQSYTIIDDLRSFRESQYQQSYAQERNTVGYPDEQPSFHQEIQKQKKTKQEALKNDLEPRNRILSKIKSQNSLKMDQILQSYNSYKQNKEQFMSEIKKNSQPTHYRAVSQTIKKPELQEKQQTLDVSFEKKQKKCVILNSIDNLWDDISKEGESRESLAETEGKQRTRAEEIMMRVASLKRQQTSRNNQNDNKGVNHHSKLILKNLVTDSATRQEPPSKMAMALSPRGLRVPGKICKNHDKSMMALGRYQS